MAAFLNDYTLLDEIGHGAFASVYKVRHNQLGYIRAVRVLNHTIAQGENDQLWLKFLAECRLLLRLGNGNNPHIVHIYQPLLRDNKALVEMDFIDGMDLAHYMNKNNRFVEAGEVVRLARHMGSALAYCHHDIYRSCMDRDQDNLQDDPDDGSQVLIDRATEARLVRKYQVIHNDLHSGNIMRRNNGDYVLLDFGLSIQDGDVLHSSKRRGGAPEYKAPEKWNDEATITTQSDIFSMGVILYEMLTGHVPFALDTTKPNQIEAEYLLMKAIQSEEAPSIYMQRKRTFEETHPGQQYEKDYPDWLEMLIERCLAKDPSMRFPSGKQFNEFIKTWTSTDSQATSRQAAQLAALRAELDRLKHQRQQPEPPTTHVPRHHVDIPEPPSRPLPPPPPVEEESSNTGYIITGILGGIILAGLLWYLSTIRNNENLQPDYSSDSVEVIQNVDTPVTIQETAPEPEPEPVAPDTASRVIPSRPSHDEPVIIDSVAVVNDNN